MTTLSALIASALDGAESFGALFQSFGDISLQALSSVNNAVMIFFSITILDIFSCLPCCEN